MTTSRFSAATAPLVPDALIGFTTEGIAIESLLRVQAASRVYQGRQLQGGGAVQVEVMAEHLAREVAFGARFRREAGQLAALHHVHVETCLGPRLWQLAVDRAALVLLSEATSGITLGELVRRERLPVCDVLRLFHQACDGLSAAHRMGIVHGDFTPDAILVTPGGTAKLGRFALGASGYAAERIEHTVTGAPEFMAPEVCRGQQPSNLSDLYSVGAVLVTILTGDVPFPARTALECIHLQQSAAVPDLAQSHPEFAVLAPVIRRMMAKDPAPRWIAADELARELLVLSGQIAPDVRCRVPKEERQRPLAALVQSALAEVPLPSVAAPPQSGPQAESTSGGTTSISRKSVDYFRNPELYKPTGATPAVGLPILPPAPPERTATRTVRREPAIPAPAPAERTTTRTVRRELAIPAPAAAPAAAAVAAPARRPAEAPPATTPAALRVGGRAPWPWQRRLLVGGVAGLVGVLLAGLAWVRPQAGVPVASAVPAPLPPAATPLAVAAPGAPAPGPALAGSTFGDVIAAIASLGRQDPAAALRQAQALRDQHPTARLPGLPLALRLVVIGPPEQAVRVTSHGKPVVLSPGLVLCRIPGQWQDLAISADGYQAQEIAIPEGPASGEQVQVVTLLNAARWSQPAFSPTWVRLFRAAGGVVVASDRKVVLLADGDGRERARLDHALLAELPEQGLTWAAALPGPEASLQFGVTGGLWLEAGTTGTFSAVHVLHRGQASVLKALRLPLTLRLGEEGIFALERSASGSALVADGQQRRLWSRPLGGRLVPWFAAEGDHLLVVGDRQVQRISQEGEELSALQLPGSRTAEPLTVAGQGLLIPTEAGLAAIATAGAVPRLLAGAVPAAVVAVVADTGQVICAGAQAITAYRIGEQGLQPLWSQAQAVAIEHRIVHLVDGGAEVIAVEEGGVMRAFRKTDGTPARTVRPGAPLLTAPLAVYGGWVVVEAPGVVRLY